MLAMSLSMLSELGRNAATLVKPVQQRATDVCSTAGVAILYTAGLLMVGQRRLQETQAGGLLRSFLP